MYCRKCGNKLNAGDNACSKCGTFVKEENMNPNAKSKVVAGLLGILIGGLGIHNFYLGYNSRGLTQLLISVLSCGVLSVVSGIWGLIEGIQILTGSINIDADGNPLSN